MRSAQAYLRYHICETMVKNHSPALHLSHAALPAADGNCFYRAYIAAGLEVLCSRAHPMWLTNLSGAVTKEYAALSAWTDLGDAAHQIHLEDYLQVQVQRCKGSRHACCQCSHQIATGWSRT